MGSKEKPLKTITEATKRVNSDNQSGCAESIITAGRYLISETALLKNNRNLSINNRITIRAEILPDDVNWNPQLMPTIVTAVPLQKDDFGETAFGFDIEVSHVTIQGLRFLGGLDLTISLSMQNCRFLSFSNFVLENSKKWCWFFTNWNREVYL